MGQLLVMLIIPPIVGVVTYMVVRLIWERDKNGASEAVKRRDPSADGGLTETVPVYATLNESDGTTTLVFGDGIEGASLPTGQSYIQANYRVGIGASGNTPTETGRAHIYGMAKVTCHCGAIYAIIETKGPTEDQSSFKCVLCEKELLTQAGSNVSASEPLLKCRNAIRRCQNRGLTHLPG